MDRPPDDIDAFDDLMALGDPVALIVTTIADGERSGCVVGFHSQCGIRPPRHAVWLSRPNHTHRVGARARLFAVHWIPGDRHDLAALFGGTTGDDVDKLADCDWTEGPGGVPLLDGCPDRYVGRRLAWLDVDADHTCVVLEPIDVHTGREGRRRAGPAPLRTSHLADVDAGHPADE